jgi:hypothetical protein
MLVAPNRVNAETTIVVQEAVASARHIAEHRLAGR